MASPAPGGEAGTPRAGPPLWLPGHVRLQMAGSIGLLSIGGGWSFFRDRLQAEALYGFAPASVAGVDVHTLSQKTTVAPVAMCRPGGLDLHPILLGYSANVAQGEKYDLILPERFQGYYWPSALHFWIFAGARAGLRNPGRGAMRKVSAVAEAGATDVYWQAWMENSELSLREIISLSLAVQIHFRDD